MSPDRAARRNCAQVVLPAPNDWAAEGDASANRKAAAATTGRMDELPNRADRTASRTVRRARRAAPRGIRPKPSSIKHGVGRASAAGFLARRHDGTFRVFRRELLEGDTEPVNEAHPGPTRGTVVS